MLANGVVSAAYIAASILFILSLGGLSNQESAKRAVWYGIVGMAIAVIATILAPGVQNMALIIVAVAAGAFAGQYVAGRVQMTEMPQLVAALHSFVGLAAGPLLVGVISGGGRRARAVARGRLTGQWAVGRFPATAATAGVHRYRGETQTSAPARQPAGPAPLR